MPFDYSKNDIDKMVKVLGEDATKIKYAFGKQLFDANLWDAYRAVASLLQDIRLALAQQNLQGFTKKPEVVMLPDGSDHLTWLEVGKEEEKGLTVVLVTWAPNFGHLWRSGWISREELEKAKKDGSFEWLHRGISGHGSP